ncbi:MAG: tetratricopeptide repeat protein [Myxococcales bacterium]|nr:tetratricopeptide repeat protein [Myxococcales bacterium]
MYASGTETDVPRKAIYLAALAVFAAAFLIYLPKLANPFTFDDRLFIQTDPNLRDWSAALGEFGRDQASLYRPLRSLVLAGLIRLSGVENPVPFHLTGMLLHAVVSACVVLIVWLLTGRLAAALLAGLLFAWHPVHSDRVAFITAGFDLLGPAFGYAAWALALAYDRGGRRIHLWATGLLLAIGCFGGEEAVMTWPLVGGSLFLFRGDRRRRIVLLAVLGAAVVFYLAARTMVLGSIGRTPDYAAGSLGNSVLSMAVIFWRYIGLTFWPIGLSPAYGPTVYTHLNLASLAGLLGIAGLPVLAIVGRKRSPGLALGIGWFLIALFPYSNLLPADTLMDERYLYSALGGFAAAAGLALAWMGGQRKGAWLVVACLLAVYGANTVARCRVWERPLTLWTQAVTREPNSFLANLNAAYHLLAAGETAAGERYARRAHELNPRRTEPLLQLADPAFARGDDAAGVNLLEQAVAAEPQSVAALSALAQAYVKTGRLPEAARLAEQALAGDRRDTRAHYVLAYLAVTAGRCDLAAPHWQAVLSAVPQAREYEAARQLQEHCSP